MKALLPASFLLLPLALFGGTLTDPDHTLERIPHDFALADGPAWDGWSLWIPDVKAGTLYRYIPKQNKVVPMLKEAGRLSATFYQEGRLVVSDNANARIVWLNGKELLPIAGNDPKAKPPQRPNDLVVDARGGIWYTLTNQDEVRYIDPATQTQHTATTAAPAANGITLSPDGSTLYVAAYRTKEILAFAVKGPGALGPRRTFATMDDGEALGADGMCIDRAGNVYCAGATDIWIWAPDGTLLEKIPCPERPINCTFGDSDYRSLYITGFGGLYRQRMRAYGIPSNPPVRAGKTTTPIDPKRPGTLVPETVTVQRNVVYHTVGTRKLLADLYIPKANGPFPGVILVHGGGWLQGDKTKFTSLAIALAQKGYSVMNVGYRLGYETPFPAGVQDANAATRFLRTHADTYKVAPQRIGAVGGSAGGHIVGLMATASDNAALHGEAIQAAAVMAGPMEITTGSVAERVAKEPHKSNIFHWTGGTPAEKPDLYQLADAHRHISPGDAPTLFLVGSLDHPERNAPSRAAFQHHGVPTGVKIYANAKHGAWNGLPWQPRFVEDIDAWFKIHLK